MSAKSIASKKRAAPATSGSASGNSSNKRVKGTARSGSASTALHSSRASSPSGSTRHGSVSFEEVVDVDALASDVEENAAESSDAELERLQKGWTSTIYAFYQPTVTVGYEKKRRYHCFKCAAKGCSKEVKRFLDSKDRASTSNLRAHAVKCFGDETVKAAAENCKDAAEARDQLGDKIGQLRSGTITAMFERQGKGKVTYSHRPHTATQARAEIVRWVSESARPFSIVKDRGFQCLMKTGRPTYQLPSIATVSRDVRNVFLNCRKRMANLLQNYDGELSFATDTWTSPNHKPLMAVTVHFMHNDTPMTLLLDIVELSKSHTGINLAIAFATILDDFGIADKILAVSCDNASANDVMIREMAERIAHFAGDPSRVRCFAHIIALVAKSILRQFDPPTKKKKKQGAPGDAEEEDDVDAVLRELETALEAEEAAAQESADEEQDNGDGWVDELAQMSDAERLLHEDDVRPIRLGLVKLRKLAHKVLNSTTIFLPRWRELCTVHKISGRTMPRDVRTRWNSSHDMLDFALEYRAVIDSITGERELGLRNYELSAEEWQLMQQLHSVLKILKHATSFFSRANTPNLATVIPAMDHIDSVFSKGIDDKALHPSIRHALELGKRALNRYYSATDYSNTYRIAMVLHPRHKLEYFRNAGWEADWIKTAEEIVRDEFNMSYARTSGPVAEAIAVPAKKVGGRLVFASFPFFPSSPPLLPAQPQHLYWNPVVHRRS